MTMSVETIDDTYSTRHSDSFSVIQRHDPVVYENSLHLDALDSQNVRFFEDNGYLFFPRLFSTKEVSAFSNELEQMSNDDEQKKREQFILEPHSNEVCTIFVFA